MPHRQLVCLALVSMLACRGRAAAPAHAAGDTTYHGVAVADPQRWLEDPASPKVKQFVDAQNARVDSVVATFAEGPELARRIAQLSATSVQRLSPTIAGSWLYYLDERPPAPQPVLVRAAWPSGAERVVVDVNSLPGSQNITAYWPGPGGRYVAYGTATGGSELTTVHFIDAESGKLLPDTLPFAGGGTSPPMLAWDADGKGVTYTRFPIPAPSRTVSWFDLALYHHLLGAPHDTPALGQGYSPIAEYLMYASTDSRDAAVIARKGDSGPEEVYRREAGAWRRVVGDTAGVLTAAFSGDRLLVVATNGTPRGRIVAVERNGTASTIVSERPWTIQFLSPIAGGLLVAEDSGPRWRVEQFTAAGSLVRVLALPPDNISVTGIASSSTSSDAIIDWMGWTWPPRWQRYDARTGALTTLYAVKPAADYSRIAAHTIDAVSKDGTHIPVTVLAMPNTPRDASAPAILQGYGGFDIPWSPVFSPRVLAWLERGGVFAVANIRGGNEFGEDWHRNGVLTKKQNGFDDFFAAAQALVDAKWTSHDRLGIQGGSNGGLLMGAELTQHPEAFRAVVSTVGIYDMLRHHTFPNGAFNVPEYGDVADSAQFAAMYAYSPYHHVKQGTAYPAVLLQTAANDARVAPWQSRKFAAALQAATSSERPVLLLTQTSGGHGVDAPFAQRVGQATLAFTFFAHELGLTMRDSASTDRRARADLHRVPGTLHDSARKR
jgi:prolyl oligopeptidase